MERAFGVDCILCYMIINKKTKLYSILYLKCPRCHQGDLFSAKNPYILRSMLDMPHRCPVCQQDLMMEPGFYSGALWTSYPIVIGILVITWLLLHSLFQFPASSVFITGAVIALIFQPIIMRLGRAIWINLFVPYRGTQG